MGVATGFLNQDQVKVATIELVNLNTPNDGGVPQYWDTPATGHARFPYQKTRSGVINSNMSLRERTLETKLYLASGVVFLLMSIATKKPPAGF